MNSFHFISNIFLKNLFYSSLNSQEKMKSVLQGLNKAEKFNLTDVLNFENLKNSSILLDPESKLTYSYFLVYFFFHFSFFQFYSP